MVMVSTKGSMGVVEVAAVVEVQRPGLYTGKARNELVLMNNDCTKHIVDDADGWPMDRETNEFVVHGYLPVQLLDRCQVVGEPGKAASVGTMTRALLSMQGAQQLRMLRAPVSLLNDAVRIRRTSLAHDWARWVANGKPPGQVPPPAAAEPRAGLGVAEVGDGSRWLPAELRGDPDASDTWGRLWWPHTIERQPGEVVHVAWTETISAYDALQTEPARGALLGETTWLQQVQRVDKLHRDFEGHFARLVIGEID